MKMKMFNSVNDVVTVHDGFIKFMLYVSTKNLSERTKAYYQLEYQRFVAWLPNKFYNVQEPIEDNLPINMITIETVQFYTNYLQTATKANDVTIATYMRAIRAFLYYNMRQGYVSNFYITIPKAEKKIKPTYTEAELKVLLKKPNLKKCTFMEYQIWVMENYLLATGNRLSTVINLQIKDLDFDNQLISMTTTKNRKQQIVPMSDSLKPILLEYLTIRKKNGCKDSDYVFCSINGQKIAVRSIEDDVRRYNHSRGVYKTSIHSVEGRKHLRSNSNTAKTIKVLVIAKECHSIEHFCFCYGCCACDSRFLCRFSIK
jgi:integrase/recombinase XerD